MSRSPSARIARAANKSAGIAALRHNIRYCECPAERAELEAALARLAR